MEWIKIPTADILSGKFTNLQIAALIKYQALFASLEEEPTGRQLVKNFTSTERAFLADHMSTIRQRVVDEVSKVQKKRKSNKITYCKKIKQVDFQTSESQQLSTQTAKNDELKENSPHTPHKENIKISPDGDTKSFSDEFLNFWKFYPKQRAGNKQKAYAAYCRVLKERRATSQELLASVKEYAESSEVARGFAKGCAAWLNDDRFAVEYIPEETSGYVSPEIPVCCNSSSRSPASASSNGMYDWWSDGTLENRV